MDPFTMMAISSLAPTIISGLMGGNQQPGASGVNNINPAQLQPYQTQMLQNAFSPQSGLLDIALNKSNTGVSNSLANRGLANSSLADSTQRQNSTDITNAWLQNETQRQNQALSGVVNANNGSAGIYGAQSADAYQRYLQTQKNTSGIAQGIGSGLGGLASAYMGYQQNQQQQGQYAQLMKMMSGGGMGGAPDPYSYMNSNGYTPGSSQSTMSVGY
jgi:hypothetical protein